MYYAIDFNFDCPSLWEINIVFQHPSRIAVAEFCNAFNAQCLEILTDDELKREFDFLEAERRFIAAM